ncbi:MAG: hypothetical protein K0Q55_2389 [Verrucomicrobia bacterium]|nr:hypothetical protein [Verrucomicrobiota bacterium]
MVASEESAQRRAISMDREFGNGSVAQGELEFEFNGTAWELPGDADRYRSFITLFPCAEHSGVRLVLFTGLRHPVSDGFGAEVVVPLVADGGVRREAGRGGGGIKTVGGIEVTRNRGGQGNVVIGIHVVHTVKNTSATVLFSNAVFLALFILSV